MASNSEICFLKEAHDEFKKLIFNSSDKMESRSDGAKKWIDNPDYPHIEYIKHYLPQLVDSCRNNMTLLYRLMCCLSGITSKTAKRSSEFIDTIETHIGISSILDNIILCMSFRDKSSNSNQSESDKKSTDQIDCIKKILEKWKTQGIYKSVPIADYQDLLGNSIPHHTHCSRGCDLSELKTKILVDSMSVLNLYFIVFDPPMRIKYTSVELLYIFINRQDEHLLQSNFIVIYVLGCLVLSMKLWWDILGGFSTRSFVKHYLRYISRMPAFAIPDVEVSDLGIVQTLVLLTKQEISMLFLLGYDYECLLTIKNQECGISSELIPKKNLKLDVYMTLIKENSPELVNGDIESRCTSFVMSPVMISSGYFHEDEKFVAVLAFLFVTKSCESGSAPQWVSSLGLDCDKIVHGYQRLQRYSQSLHSRMKEVVEEHDQVKLSYNKVNNNSNSARSSSNPDVRLKYEDFHSFQGGRVSSHQLPFKVHHQHIDFFGQSSRPSIPNRSVCLPSAIEYVSSPPPLPQESSPPPPPPTEVYVDIASTFYDIGDNMLSSTPPPLPPPTLNIPPPPPPPPPELQVMSSSFIHAESSASSNSSRFVEVKSNKRQFSVMLNSDRNLVGERDVDRRQSRVHPQHNFRYNSSNNGYSNNNFRQDNYHNNSSQTRYVDHRDNNRNQSRRYNDNQQQVNTYKPYLSQNRRSRSRSPPNGRNFNSNMNQATFRRNSENQSHYLPQQNRYVAPILTNLPESTAIEEGQIQ